VPLPEINIRVFLSLYGKWKNLSLPGGKDKGNIFVSLQPNVRFWKGWWMIYEVQDSDFCPVFS